MAFPYLTRPTISSAVRPVGDFTVAGTAADRGLDKVDPRLVDIIQKAAAGSPYDVELFSGKRNGSAGRSRHNTGNAVDIVLIDRATGKPVPNLKSSVGFPIYRDFALQVRDVQMAEYPDLENALRWGGGFAGTEETYGAVDLMHFDIKPGGKMKGLVGGDLSAKAAWEAGLKLNPDQEKVVAGMGAGWVYSSEGQKRADGNVQFADFSGRNRDLGSPTDANNPKGLTPPASIPNAGKPVTLSATDRDAAVRTVIGESLGEGEEGQVAVAHVIRNRFVTGGGKSVAAIATDDSQFDAWNHDLVTAYNPGDPEYDRTAAIVDGVFDGTAPDPTGGATFFYSGKKEPGFWSKGVTKVKTIGNHVFGVAKDAVRTVLPKPPAVAASDRYTEEQQVSRPDVIAGKLQVKAPGADEADDDRSPLEAYLAGGPGFDFQTGGKTKTFGSMPYGEYPISPLTTAAERKAAGRSWQEDAFPLPDMVDPKMATFTDPDLKRTARAQGGRRTGMLIHSGDDIDKLLNAGCLAIPQEQWPAFKRTLLAQQEQYGDLVLELSPEGAVIHPKEDKPADLKIVPAGEFVAENRAAAAPVVADAETALLRQEKGGKATPENAALQAALRSKGLYQGKVDGKFGPRTKDALIAYQKAAGLKPDGVAGPASLASLGLPTTRAELAKAVPNPELPANRRLADQAAADLIAQAAAAVPSPRPRPERGAGVPDPRANPRRAPPAAPLTAVRPEFAGRLPAARPDLETIRAAPGAGNKLSQPVREQDSADRIIAQAGIPPDGPTARAIKAQLRAPDATQVFGPGQTGVTVPAAPAASVAEDGPPPLVATDPVLQKRLDAARLDLAAAEDKRSRVPAAPVRPATDPRDVLRMALDPGGDRIAIQTGGKPPPADRVPNVSGRTDMAGRDHAPWYDRALTSVLPDENFVYDYVYDPTRPARSAPADAPGPVRPNPAVVASGDQPVDPLNLFSHLDKNKDQARVPGMGAADAASMLASADALSRPLSPPAPTMPDTLSRYVEEPIASGPAETASGRVLSAAAMIGGPSYVQPRPPYRGAAPLSGLTTADTAIDLGETEAALPAIAPPPIEPEESSPSRGPLAAYVDRARTRAGNAVQNQFSKIINPLGAIFGGPGSSTPPGSPTPASRLFGQTPFVPRADARASGTTPVGGMSYTLGTVGNRNAIQGNGWTAVEQSDGSYSMSYG